MPATTRINAEQRRGLYELVRNDLGGIGDVAIALEEKGDVATAERLGRKFAEDLRLLEDLGWHPEDERQAFALTMAGGELTKLLDRLRGEAACLPTGSASERRCREADKVTEALIWHGLHACEEVLTVLEGKGGDAR
jgi:hypothetical protein